MGDSKTELDSIIAGLAWSERYTLGQGTGVNAITGSTSAMAVKPFKASLPGTKTSSEYYRFVQSESDLSEEVQASLSGKYNIDGVTVTGSMSYLEKLRYSQLNITLIARYQSVFDGYEESDVYTLSDEARDVIHDPDIFRDRYGDYFVAGAKGSSTFTAVYQCSTTSASDMTEFCASLGVSAPQVFSVQGSTKFEEAASTHNVNVSTHLFMDGYSGTPPEKPMTPAGILELLEWFKGHEAPVYLKAKLRHYSTIAPAYPRTVPVDPTVFVELRTLYTAYWAVRSQYASCPVPSKPLQDGYQELVYTVEANQNTLATDVALRQDLQKKADDLLEDLREIFDRQDFYVKVQQRVSSEPSEGTEHDEGNGNEVWTYGYTEYPVSTAVNLQVDVQRYEESSHIGWREHDFVFQADARNAIVVGWQVVALWQDGTNGQWWKAATQNILGREARVHVKSLYDRGCAWQVKFFYVDAADYPYGT